jgi:hypothetical protein
MNAKKCKALRRIAEVQTAGKHVSITRAAYRKAKRLLMAESKQGQFPKPQPQRTTLDATAAMLKNKFKGFRKVRKFDSDRGITRWMANA